MVSRVNWLLCCLHLDNDDVDNSVIFLVGSLVMERKSHCLYAFVVLIFNQSVFMITTRYFK